MRFVQLNTTTNFTFLTGASHPAELVYQAHSLGYEAIAITDECSLAGIVKAHVAAEEVGIKLIVGSRFRLSNGMHVIAIAPSRIAYAELSGFITLARRRMEKGRYQAHFEDLRFRLKTCLMILVADLVESVPDDTIEQLTKSFRNRLWIGIDHRLRGGEHPHFLRWIAISKKYRTPLLACAEALMHIPERKPLQDALTAIRHNCSVAEMGTRLQINGEAYLKSISHLQNLYPAELLAETSAIADQCHFSMLELRYQYPRELVPTGLSPIQHLRNLVLDGQRERWPDGPTPEIALLIEKELQLIEELEYEFYFLTVHDIVRYARSQNILCQGRGSAANSGVCYCLFVTEIAPGQINVLFERFISHERDEPPDIDIDFEHQRREEVIQYIYRKYGRERAAIAATVVSYRPRSAVRDVGKALGFNPSLVDHLAKSISWWDEPESLPERVAAAGVDVEQQLIGHFLRLCNQILGFPRHLSQHVGGFVIAEGRLSDLVPLENASMSDRTIIQWDKDDLENMRLLKVDVLALGMLSAIRRTLDLVNSYDPSIRTLADIPREDPATYEMLCHGDSTGIFQVESRAQMAMLPRLQPRRFYDLVIQIAIVRPGPIQGDMVHPFLRRRAGLEPIEYPSEEIRKVLEPTLGVPIFQEQVMRLSMIAAGFTGGEADQLRRAMTAWGKNSKLLLFQDKFINGLLKNGYSRGFAERTFEQVKGFGGYGFPESHSASFALLAYASSWLKCHHPAAFCCSLLNSQPMGFYSPSLLLQDLRRHGVPVLPVDVNASEYDHTLEQVKKQNGIVLGVRLGFRIIKSLNAEDGMAIPTYRGAEAFRSIDDFTQRTRLSRQSLQLLASADAFRSLLGDRHRAHWQVAAAEPPIPLGPATIGPNQLVMDPPTLEKDVLDDYRALGLTLKAHPMELLRQQKPFSKCTKCVDLVKKRHQSFVQIAGLVTGLQKPGTAKGTLFMTVEDETGNINVVIWGRTQQHFRQTILTSRLVVIKGTVEIASKNVAHPVIHVIAGHITDATNELRSLVVKAWMFR
jgi:error-prone DNA polymerase